MYFVLESSQLKEENGLCGFLAFFLGRLWASTWDGDENERNKTHSL